MLANWKSIVENSIENQNSIKKLKFNEKNQNLIESNQNSIKYQNLMKLVNTSSACIKYRCLKKKLKN